MKKTAFFSLLLAGLFFSLTAVAQGEKVDLEVIYKIKHEGLYNSQMDDLAFWMTDYVGPRLTASPNKHRANEWVKERMEEYGFENVRIEKARDFTQGGWTNERSYAAMTAPYYCNFNVTPKAWSGSTNGLVKAEVVLMDAETMEDLEAFKGKLAGKIILMPSTQTYEPDFGPIATRYSEEELKAEAMAQMPRARSNRNFDMAAYRARMDFRNSMNEMLKEEGIIAIVNSSGVFGVPRSNSARHSAGDEPGVAELNVPLEFHGRMQRLLEHDVPVEMEVDIKNTFAPENTAVTNVIGEIPGTDPKLKDQVVLIGGHWDCWHGGTGAADNASGCMVMLEALRILKEIGVQPRRTIRLALWGGEEQGLHGSRGYLEKYLYDRNGDKQKKGYEQFAAYFNMDYGTGKFRGIYTQENDQLRPIFEAWLAPFEDMGCNTISNRRAGGTDHLTFDGIGLPAFQFIQDDIEYNRGYHTNMDTWERLMIADLKHNAVVAAAMAWQAAQRDEVLPRKPQVK